jgi:hypothetical protein
LAFKATASFLDGLILESFQWHSWFVCLLEYKILMNVILFFQLEMCLGIIIKDSSSEDIAEYYKKYLRLLYKNKKVTLLLEEARNMHLLYPESELPLEWICKVYSEQIAQGVEVSCVFENNIDEYYKKLEALNSESSMALLAKGAELFKNKNFIEACDAVIQGRFKNLDQTQVRYLFVLHSFIL